MLVSCQCLGDGDVCEDPLLELGLELWEGGHHPEVCWDAVVEFGCPVPVAVLGQGFGARVVFSKSDAACCSLPGLIWVVPTHPGS